MSLCLEIKALRREFLAPDGSVLPVVNIDRLEIAAGEHVALMGKSGTGKTTLLHLIAGVLPPTSGEVIHHVEGQSTDIARLSESRRDIFRGRFLGYIFQTSLLIPAFTALENVLLGMSFTHRPQDRPWAMHLLEKVGLAQRAGFRPEKLSIGQQQRVAIARALANRPRLVLADEPTGALDAGNAQSALELMRGLCQEVSATLLMVTHDVQVAAAMARKLHWSDLHRETR